MVKFVTPKNIRRICVILCLVVVMLPVSRIQAAEIESQQSSTTPETAMEDKSTTHERAEYKPWARNPLKFSEYSLSLIDEWLDVETFISAEMLQSRFGNFDTFTFFVDGKTYPGISGIYVTEYYTDAYVYVFNTESGGKYNVNIAVEKLQADGVVRHLPVIAESLETDDIDPRDLRKADKPGTYCVGNIAYTYMYHKEYDEKYSNLTYFQWQSDGYALLIDVEEFPIDQYTLDDGGFIAQMLRQDTALYAVEQFAVDLFPEHYQNEATDDSTEKDSNWMIWIVPGVIVVSVAATFLLFRHRRKRKAAMLVQETPDEPDTDPWDSKPDTE